MGYGTRNGRIKTFWPDDDDKTIYRARDLDLSEIIELAKEKWGDGVDFDNITIRSEYIHTDCLTHDQYDPSDYTRFVVIEHR